jgi:glycosyltransferase involved in cell wall biosynthesis
MRLGFISATLSLDCLRMTADQMVRWPKLLYNYRSFLAREQPRHIIHTNWHHVMLLWPFLRPDRDIFWLHEVVSHKPQYVKLFQALAKYLCCFVTVSEAVAGGLRQIGVPDAKIEVIHNGITDPAVGAPTNQETPNGAAIGIVGQVAKWKGHEDLLEAFASLAPRYSSASLHIFGSFESDFARKLKYVTAASALADRVFWHGYIAERREIYGRIDILAVPSLVSDPLPTTAIEAAFLGLPVVATRMGGLPEIVIDGETGYLVQPNSSGELAARLEQLLQSVELRTRTGAAARQRALRYFSRDRFIADFLLVLESRCASPSGALIGPDA